MKQNLEHNLLADPNFIDWVLAPDEISDEHWRNWRRKNPERISEFEEAKLFLTSIHFTDNSAQINEDNLLKKIHKNIEDLNSSKLGLKHILGVAAFLALIFCTWFFLPSNDNFNTQFSEIKEFNLPDGSHVALNANSELEIIGDWEGNDDRNVLLKGEAYFEVSKTPIIGSSKFNVYTTKGIIKVLGTKFNVKDRSEEFSVALDEGKVIFEADKQSMELAPGEAILLDQNIIQKEQLNTQNFSMWKKMEINLENVTLLEIANVLEDFHGVKIIFNQEALKSRPGAAGLLEYSDLNESLDVIKDLFNINSKKEGQTISFSY